MIILLTLVFAKMRSHIGHELYLRNPVWLDSRHNTTVLVIRVVGLRSAKTRECASTSTYVRVGVSCALATVAKAVSTVV